LPTSDASPDAAFPPASADVEVPSCGGLNESAETCEVHYRYDASRCTRGAPCTKLALFFAGGDQNCAAASYRNVVSAYVDAGYVAACLEIFETSVATGLVPYAQEAERVDRVLRAALDLLRGPWSGEHLLVTGISHGATAPVIAAARTTLDDAWHGTGRTAACFYDGVYDIGALDAFVGTSGGDGGPCGALTILPHERAVGRYYGAAGPLLHACTNQKCFCDPRHAPAMDTDTIVTVSPRELAIKTWKLIECGSAMAACNQDVIPGAPVAALCTQIRTGSADGYSCDYDSMPSDSHLRCHETGVSKCLSWFDALAR